MHRPIFLALLACLACSALSLAIPEFAWALIACALALAAMLIAERRWRIASLLGFLTACGSLLFAANVLTVRMFLVVHSFIQFAMLAAGLTMRGILLSVRHHASAGVAEPMFSDVEDLEADLDEVAPEAKPTPRIEDSSAGNHRAAYERPKAPPVTGFVAVGGILHKPDCELAEGHERRFIGSKRYAESLKLKACEQCAPLGT